MAKARLNDGKTCISAHKPYHTALNPHHDGIIVEMLREEHPVASIKHAMFSSLMWNAFLSPPHTPNHIDKADS